MSDIFTKAKDVCDSVLKKYNVYKPYCIYVGNLKPLCNCFTPMRYLWSHYEEYLQTLSFLKRVVFKIFAPYLKKWDRKSSDSVHYYIANSKTVQARVKKYYNRESVVINPPVRYNYFKLSKEKEDYYFVLSALVSYKRIDLAVDAFNKLGYKLKIAGSGPDFEKLKNKAKSNIEFLGRVEDDKLLELYGKAKAFIFPGEEDFGITPLESQACGTPVIAFRKGGATETVIDGKTGIFFDMQNSEELIEAVKRFEENGVELSPLEIRKSVQLFSEDIYQQKIKNFVYEKWEEFNK